MWLVAVTEGKGSDLVQQYSSIDSSWYCHIYSYETRGWAVRKHPAHTACISVPRRKATCIFRPIIKIHSATTKLVPEHDYTWKPMHLFYSMRKKIPHTQHIAKYFITPQKN